MVVAQKLNESEITEHNSLLLTRNLLGSAVFNISYITGLFPENYFIDQYVPALETKIKKLMPIDAESRRLIDWMEKGVYDSLQKKYLKTLLFCISKAVDGPVIEEYAFSFSYSNSENEEVTMNINRTGNKGQGATFKSNDNKYNSSSLMRSSAYKMVRTIVQLIRSLHHMPEEHAILMKLLCYEDVTPIDYEPPFFRDCSEQEANHPWLKNPPKMETGNVNSKHFVLALKVKSNLGPCQDENYDFEVDEETSLGVDSRPTTEISDSGISHSTKDDGIFESPEDETRPRDNNGMANNEDYTQDAGEDDHQLTRVRNWIVSRHINNVELTDVLSSFPGDISEIMDKLVNQNILSRTGKDSYSINKLKKHIEAVVVKEEMDVQEDQVDEKFQRVNDDDYLYMKALYHVLPLFYVTISKLQSVLEGEANQATVHKLLHKMTCDGYVEAKSRAGLGKRVIRSESTNKKLLEVTNALDIKFSTMDISEPQNMSTCGGLHSVGSDLTRTRERSVDTHMNGSSRIQEQLGNNIPIRSNETAVSRESGLQWNNKRKGVDGRDETPCSRPSQGKRSRKTSTMALKSESWKATTTVGLYFDNGRGALLAADCRGTKDGLVAADDKLKIQMLGSTRACTLAGNNKIIGDIADIIKDQLEVAESSNTELESVKQSADYVHKYFGSEQERAHVEMLVAGWDTMEKEGAPVIWYGNHVRPSFVKNHRATGSGRVFAPVIMSKHKITMSEKETVEIAEKIILEAAQCDWKTGGGIDILIVKDGKFKWLPRQTMEDIAKKYGVPVEALKQTPD